MASSEHGDLLLSHVDKLEKDRQSLEMVLEIKNQELTKLRTQIHEQINEVKIQQGNEHVNMFSSNID
jgi:hypothetical protein